MSLHVSLAQEVWIFFVDTDEHEPSAASMKRALSLNVPIFGDLGLDEDSDLNINFGTSVAFIGDIDNDG